MPGQEIHFFSAPSSQEWWRFWAILVGLVVMIGAGESVRMWRKWSPEFSRKLVHVSVGILIFFAPTLFVVPLPALILAATFITVNVIAIRFRLFPGMHGTKRISYGTVFYPLSFLILIVLFWFKAPFIISLSMLVLAFGDAAAAIVGENDPSPTIFRLTSDVKSLEGSWTMFAVSSLTMMAGVVHFFPMMEFRFLLACAGAAAITAAAWEAISSRGLDNLSIPLSVAFVLTVYLVPSSMASPQQYTVGIGLALFIAAISFYAGFLTASGAVATFLLASLIFGIGGWRWTVPILTFFVLSSLLSRIGRSRKKEFEDLFEKSGNRDHGQVAANGGVAGMVALLAFIFPSRDLYPIYLGAVAAVTADTWGTEIGLLARGRTFLITSWKAVAPGTNGGVTIIGLLGGLAGAMIIAAIGSLWGIDWTMGGFIAAAGFAGSTVDSFLGATIQARFQCRACGKTTERHQHCGQPTKHIGGLGWLRNDAVNWICALSGAVVMMLLAR